MSAPAPNRDLLSILAPELLIKIFSNVPLPNFLSLVQTSRRLRYFVKENATHICNVAIEARFAVENKILNPIRVSDPQSWICPNDPAVLEEEARCRTAMQAMLKGEKKLIIEWLRGDKMVYKLGYILSEIYGINRVKAYNLPGEKVTANRGISNFIGLTTPGPQYLFFLEEHTDYISGLVRFKHMWRRKVKTASRTNRTKKIKEDTLQAKAAAERESDFRINLDLTQNRVLRYLNLRRYCEVEYNSNGQAKDGEIEFRRAMVWYFGVDKLMGA